MKDLVDKVLKFLPQYFLVFGAIFSGPKTYFKHRDIESDDAFNTALLFIAVSLVLVQLMQIPVFAVGKDIWIFVTGQAISWLVAITIGGGTAWLAWRVVGGRAPARQIFVLYGYFLSIVTVIAATFQLLAAGIVRTFEPAFYDAIIKSYQNHIPIPPGVFTGPTVSMQVATTIFLAGLLLTFIWSVIAWGALRNLNESGRLRSALAFLIVLILALPTILIVSLMGSALF